MNNQVKKQPLRVLLLLLAVMTASFLASGCGDRSAIPVSSTAEGPGEILLIWETPAGSRPDSKLAEMNIDYTQQEELEGFAAIIGDDYRDVERDLDTLTWQREILPGYETETFEDEPYLIPYPADSDSAVIVIPGGGYVFKSIDNSNSKEGNKVALTLQKNGLNAFVLHYRSNPYEYPLPQLDVQRAVRYLKYHSDELGIDPAKISLIGFSAGGYQAGSFIHFIQGRDLFPGDYIPDDTDREDDSICAAALIYPALSFVHNVGVLFCLFDDEDVRDPEKRQQLLAMTDLKSHLTPSSEVPRFVARGDADTVIGDGPKEYIDAVRAAGGEITEVVAPGQDHSFGQSYYMTEYLHWLKEVLADLSQADPH